MPKFCKKPVFIEAMKFDGSRESYLEILEWSRSPDMLWAILVGVLSIRTRKGQETVYPGDMVIKDAAGKCYPCDPATFAATYDAVPFCPARSSSTDIGGGHADA